MDSKLSFTQARHYAEKIALWLRPHCVRLEISGSIRRERPACSDIDLCIIPKLKIHRDLLGAEIGRFNYCWMHLVNYVNNFKAYELKPGQQLPKLLSGGDQAGKRMTVQLPACQLDLWFADETNFAAKLVNSTGSMEHNIWLAQRAAFRGLHWFVSQGLARLNDLKALGIDPSAHDAADRARQSGLILPAPDEAAFYAHLGLSFIRPQDRELPWLTKNIDSGL